MKETLTSLTSSLSCGVWNVHSTLFGPHDTALFLACHQMSSFIFYFPDSGPRFVHFRLLLAPVS